MNIFELDQSIRKKKSVDSNGGISKEKETEFHADLDKLVHKTFGKRKDEDQDVAEAINPDITNPAFSHRQQIGDYLYVARYWSKGLKISAYDGDKQIGYAELMYQTAPFDDFADPKTTPKRVWLESEWTKVNPKYQRQGIMSTMYAYAKMLGNSVKPSEVRTSDARAAWKSWGADKKYLTQGVAEDSSNHVWIQGDFDGDTAASGPTQGSWRDRESTPVELVRGRMSNVRRLSGPPPSSGNTIKQAKIPLTLDAGSQQFNTIGRDLQLTVAPNGYITQGKFGRVVGTAVVKIMKPGSVEEDLNEFSPAGRDPWGDDDRGEDPYGRPEPQHYRRSSSYFEQFEADHFDDEVFDKATGVFRGYWDDAEGRVQIAYFKFDDPNRTGSDDPGMGWYYEPQNEGVDEGWKQNLAALGLAGLTALAPTPAAAAPTQTSTVSTVAHGTTGDQIVNHKNYKKYYDQALAGRNTARAHQTAQQIATLKVKNDIAKGIKEQGMAEAFGPLPKDNQQIRLGRHTVDIERVGLNKNYISFAWHDSKGKEHYEEVAVGDLGSFDDLIKRIKDEISYQERKYTDQGVAEGLNEMDKSAPQPGRDGKVSHSTYGSRDKKGSDYFKGKEAPGKAITAKQASKDALDILKKQGVAEGDNEKIGGRHDPDDFDDIVRRVGQRAKQGPLKTVWDPVKRVYKNVPVNKDKDVDEASLATMRDYFDGNLDAQDPTKISQMRKFFAKQHVPAKEIITKKFHKPDEYQQWVSKVKPMATNNVREAGPYSRGYYNPMDDERREQDWSDRSTSDWKHRERAAEEASVLYIFNSESGKLRQRMWNHDQFRQARSEGYKDTPDQAMKAFGYFPSKFKPGHYVKKGVDGKWETVFPYAKKSVDEAAGTISLSMNDGSTKMLRSGAPALNAVKAVLNYLVKSKDFETLKNLKAVDGQDVTGIISKIFKPSNTINLGEALDIEFQSFLKQAKHRYPDSKDETEAFMRFVHDELEKEGRIDRSQASEIDDLEAKIDSLVSDLAKVSKAPPAVGL